MKTSIVIKVVLKPEVTLTAKTSIILNIVDPISMTKSIIYFAARSDSFCCCGFNLMSSFITLDLYNDILRAFASFLKFDMKKYTASAQPTTYKVPPIMNNA